MNRILRDRDYFLARIIIDPKTNCWIWTKCKSTFGYGRVNIEGRIINAHRVSYELWIGPPGELFVCHKCDNPPCINPEHLFLGTQLDNMRDGARKGRVAGQLDPVKGEQHGNAKLTDADILKIRTSNNSCTRMASELGIAIITVSQIRRRLRWKHLP